MPSYTIIYDTYCGWCYGAARILDALVETGRVRLYHRYLFQGPNAHRMGDGFGSQAAMIDARIHTLTGQPFGPAYKRNILQSPDEVLNTGLAAQAAYLVMGVGAKAEMGLTSTLQRAYFADGRSTQDFDFVSNALEKFGLNGQGLGSDEVRSAAIKRGQDAAKLCDETGVFGVPTVLRHTDETEIINLSQIYKNPADITLLANSGK